jgi:anaerobic magnesium-protoporphyrin IX monomethyl ester cyclase
MTRVALIYPYFRTHTATEILFAPLGVASLSAQLQRTELEVKVFDCTFSTMEEIRASLLSYRPEIAGIYCMVTLSRNTFRIAEMIRSDLPDCLLVAGGPLPTLYPQHFNGPFDVVFRGEADESFPRFCREFLTARPATRLQLRNMDLGGYAGLYIQQDDIQNDNPIVHYSEKQINSFPLPDRRDFDHPAYQRESLLRDGVKATSIITTYGCPFDCDFCSRPVFGNRFRRRALDSVLEEVEQIRDLGYDSLWIADDNFTLDTHYLEGFCQKIAEKNIRWTCLSRVTGLDHGITDMMKAAGCRRVYLGLESGSQETLKLMNKRATLEEGIEAVHLFHRSGIEVAAFFIVGYPGERIDSIESTFQLALTLPLDEISFNVPFPLPGSRLFERVADVDTNKDWDKENEVTFVYHSEFDETWLRGRIDETMQLFTRRKRISFLPAKIAQISHPMSSNEKARR